MTTRHTSADTDYPFVPRLSDQDSLLVAGILDLYFVVQGRPTKITEGSSSSSEDTDYVGTLSLVACAVIGTDTEFTFRAKQDGDSWVIKFLVPNNLGTTGQVYNNDSSDCRAVLIFNSALIMKQGGAYTDIPVEPARAQWHTELVTSLGFHNISRCGGSEDPGTVLDVLLLAQGSSGSEDMSLSIIDGYNTEWEYSDSSLSLTAAAGIGQGVSPGYGDTGPMCSSGEEITLDSDAITVINGITPDNGNIDIAISSGFVLQRSRGRIEIGVRQ